jgi:uncharacterized membrane protein YhaH (DUF805 family)
MEEQKTNWFVNFWVNFWNVIAIPKGRLNRTDLLFYFILMWLFNILIFGLIFALVPLPSRYLDIIIRLFITYAWTIMLIKRFHDLNLSWWWVLLVYAYNVVATFIVFHILMSYFANYFSQKGITTMIEVMFYSPMYTLLWMIVSSFICSASELFLLFWPWTKWKNRFWEQPKFVKYRLISIITMFVLWIISMILIYYIGVWLFHQFPY